MKHRHAEGPALGLRIADGGLSNRGAHLLDRELSVSATAPVTASFAPCALPSIVAFAYAWVSLASVV